MNCRSSEITAEEFKIHFQAVTNKPPEIPEGFREELEQIYPQKPVNEELEREPSDEEEPNQRQPTPTSFPLEPETEEEIVLREQNEREEQERRTREKRTRKIEERKGTGRRKEE